MRKLSETLQVIKPYLWNGVGNRDMSEYICNSAKIAWEQFQLDFYEYRRIRDLIEDRLRGRTLRSWFETSGLVNEKTFIPIELMQQLRRLFIEILIAEARDLEAAAEVPEDDDSKLAYAQMSTL